MKKRLAAALALIVALSQPCVFAAQNAAEREEGVVAENYDGKINLAAEDEKVELLAQIYGDFEYSVNTDDTVTITKYTGSGTNITIPSEIDEKKVTQIGYCAFYDCSSLTSVTIPDSVTQIDDGAFCDCSSLTSVTIPDGVTEIGDDAFRFCESITSFTVSENNANYASKDGVLFNKDMTELMYYPASNNRTAYTIPDTVTEIGWGAFFDCSSLTSVEIPDRVTQIGSYAFYNCESITSFTVSENNANYASKDGVLFNKDMTRLIQYPIGNSKTAYTIPDSVKQISNYAFENCDNLTSVTIPDSVKQISHHTFYNCDNLIICGYSGSYAEEYASKYNIPFVRISSFAFNDVALTEPTASYADNKVTVDISVTNSNESSEKFTLYAVGYSADGAMVGIKAVSVTGNSYNDGIKFDTTEKPAYVKVFAINAVNGASPLCVAQETKEVN